MNFLDAPAPRWLTIGGHRPFLADLAKGLLEALRPDDLPDATVLLPTRRSARALADAFLAAAPDRALLLPQMRALGDLDEDEAPFEPGDIGSRLPSAISPARRRFELAGLVGQHHDMLGRKFSAAVALELADALGRFLDACQIEAIDDPDVLSALVDAELARHWEISAGFLDLALSAWPKRLAALGHMDIWQRRVALLRALSEQWRRSPTERVTVVAGSTGTIPAAAELMIAIAAAPRGAVVLPGLDKSLAERAWTGADEQHPQGALRRLIERAGIGRGEVRDWDPAAETSVRGRWRRRVVGEALRPPEETDDWLGQIDNLRAEGPGRDPIAEGLEGLSVIAARDEEEEARIAALLMREALETPGRTCALVSPDQALARRVSALMSRWSVTVDLSAGAPLALAPIAVLLGQVARTAADPLDPVTLLAVLKHPLVRLGLPADDLRRGRRTLEREALRAARGRDWAALEARLGPKPAADGSPAGPERIAALATAKDLLGRLDAGLALARAPLTLESPSVSQAAQGLARALESLAESAAGDVGDLWAGLAGERAAALLASLIEESGALPPVTPRGFAELLDGLLAAEMIPIGAPAHPRLKILGVLEARLISADLIILASLEEGVWPQAAPLDPFLSRPMRASLGLPPPERRIGLSAHDFAQAAAAPEVVMLHADRRGGAPAVQSRWLWRLATLAKGAKVPLPSRPEVVDWARALDAPLAAPPPHLATATRPRARPPVEARPRRISVTGVELWLRDAYAIYARDVLKLRPLERPDAAIGPRERGTAVHAAFERFVIDHPGETPDEATFAAILERALIDAGMPQANMAWEQARAAKVAPHVIAFEKTRRPADAIHVELRGEMTFETARGPFTLSAKADRIEARGPRADILDFKTGRPPTENQVRAVLTPQLTLTAAILAAGGFAPLGAREPGELLYVRVSGGRVPLEAKPSIKAPESAVLAAGALRKLRGLAEAFDHRETAYVSWRIPQFMERWGGDYDHLARVWEWNVVGDDEDEA